MEPLSKLQPSGYDLYNLACFRSLLSGIAAAARLRNDGGRRPELSASRPSRPFAGRSPPDSKTSRTCEKIPTSFPCVARGLSNAAHGPRFPCRAIC